ncbi:helix-turn-helix transcriptional regulator [Thermopolyspora sp. NPDC052614]|uniref:helix-turn-helix domain-containing protein n=1 Tax=Thermopolyspora sp. NPDC052614 TaxID=3155682 RepID=UPI00344812F2
MRRLREAAELTQSAVAARLGCTQTQVSRIEIAKRVPSRSNAERLDELFGLTERQYFVGLYRRIISYPAGQAWFLDWVDDIEPVAVVLRSWDPLLIPGLLQTEAYARCVFGQEPRITPEEVDDRVTSRLQRQRVLAKKNPPSYMALIDEYTLHRRVGTAEVMREQLAHLLQMASLPTISIQVVDTQCLAGMLGAFTIAELPNGEADAILADSSAEGQVTDDPDIVSSIWSRYDMIRLYAYPERISLEMIEKARHEWT